MFNLKKSPDVISSLQTVVFILLCVGVSIPQDLIYSSFTSQFFSDSAFFCFLFPVQRIVALGVKISKGSVISILMDYNCYHKDLQCNLQFIKDTFLRQESCLRFEKISISFVTQVYSFEESSMCEPPSSNISHLQIEINRFTTSNWVTPLCHPKCMRHWMNIRIILFSRLHISLSTTAMQYFY